MISNYFVTVRSVPPSSDSSSPSRRLVQIPKSDGGVKAEQPTEKEGETRENWYFFMVAVFHVACDAYSFSPLLPRHGFFFSLAFFLSYPTWITIMPFGRLSRFIGRVGDNLCTCWSQIILIQHLRS